VLIEHPVATGWKVVSTPAPEETTPSAYRFRLAVPAGQTATLDVDETTDGSVRYSVGELDEARVMLLVQGGGNRAALEQALAPVTAKRAELAQTGARHFCRASGPAAGRTGGRRRERDARSGLLSARGHRLPLV